MVAQPAEPMVFSAMSALTRFSGFFYQCYMLPLALAILTLGLGCGKRLRPRRFCLWAGAALAAAAALYFLCAPAVGEFSHIGTVSHVMLMSIIVLFAGFCCPMQGHAKVVMTAAIIANINFAQSISTQILMPVMPLPLSNLAQLGILLVALGVVYLFRPGDSEEPIPTAYWLSMLVIAALSTACLYAIRTMGGRSLVFAYESWRTMGVVLSAFFVVNLLIYYLYYVLVREHRASESAKAMQAKLAQDLEFYRRSESVAREYRSLRHELKNHIAVMEAMLRDREYDRLARYFSDYAGKAIPTLAEFRCDNPLVSSVISHQMNSALAAGVRLDVIAAVPERLGIEDDDLCSVLSNMLDNGVEACVRAGKDLVKAALHTEKGCLFITVMNPVDGDVLKENPDLHSTKDNPSHGFGIPIMRRITEKYDGIVSFHVEDGWFTADAMMYMEE